LFNQLVSIPLNLAVFLSSLCSGHAVAAGGPSISSPSEFHFAANRAQPGDTPAPHLRVGNAVSQAEAFAPVGRPVQNLQGQHLGEVEGVLVTPDGQVSAVVMATGSLLSLTRDHYAIPWTRVHWQYDGEYLSLDVERTQLTSEFSSFEPDD
jgi:hypothetical protein